MLQQTRVAAVVPYYESFLHRYPSVERLAAAPEADVLSLWAGLGYYSRARNLHSAARRIASSGSFPRTYDEIRALEGVGAYTAAAIASLCFGVPVAVLDGNVMRVLARLVCEPGDIRSSVTRTRLQALANSFLDRRRPGDFNQAIMELGATVCLPANPACPACPIRDNCASFRENRQLEFPVKLRDRRSTVVRESLLVIRRGANLLMWQRPPGSPRMAGFWELPEAATLPQACLGLQLGFFRHSITVYRFEITVFQATVENLPAGFQWIPLDRLETLPVSTLARKALRLL
jgi:A/G-specific adenine glycosylase